MGLHARAKRIITQWQFGTRFGEGRGREKKNVLIKAEEDRKILVGQDRRKEGQRKPRPHAAGGGGKKNDRTRFLTRKRHSIKKGTDWNSKGVGAEAKKVFKRKSRPDDSQKRRKERGKS